MNTSKDDLKEALPFSEPPYTATTAAEKNTKPDIPFYETSTTAPKPSANEGKDVKESVPLAEAPLTTEENKKQETPPDETSTTAPKPSADEVKE
ncbi:unnamed protein product, partial [Didymodactylos carnosus]